MESLQGKVSQGLLISGGTEEKNDHTEQFSFKVGSFFPVLRVWGLESGGRPSQPTDLRDYTSYYCTCHLFSLALGMFAMVTAHSGLSVLTPAVLCISQLGCDEGKSLPVIPNP